MARDRLRQSVKLTLKTKRTRGGLPPRVRHDLHLWSQVRRFSPDREIVVAKSAQNRNRTSKRNQGWAQWAVSVAQVMAPPKSSRLQIDWRRPGPMLK